MQTNAAPNLILSLPIQGEKSDQHASIVTEVKLQYLPKVQCIHFKIAARSKVATNVRRASAPHVNRRKLIYLTWLYLASAALLA
jgi:hypothetical protein